MDPAHVERGLGALSAPLPGSRAAEDPLHQVAVRALLVLPRAELGSVSLMGVRAWHRLSEDPKDRIIAWHRQCISVVSHKFDYNVVMG